MTCQVWASQPAQSSILSPPIQLPAPGSHARASTPAVCHWMQQFVKTSACVIKQCCNRRPWKHGHACFCWANAAEHFDSEDAWPIMLCTLMEITNQLGCSCDRAYAVMHERMCTAASMPRAQTQLPKQNSPRLMEAPCIHHVPEVSDEMTCSKRTQTHRGSSR